MKILLLLIERIKGKTINFSIIYGIGAPKLASDLNIKTKEASELISSYFKQYPKV
jgi:DNA polymerase-1